MKILFIALLIFTTQIFGQASKKGSFSKKYDQSLTQEKKGTSRSHNINYLMKNKFADFKKAFDSLDLIRKEFVQYFGKKERTYIVSILRKLENAQEIPRMKLKGDEVHFITTRKLIKIKMVSFIAQRFSVNDGLEVSIKDFSSLENYMQYIVPKLDIVLNSKINFDFGIISKAHAQVGAQATDETDIVAISIALLVIKIIHGRSDTCGEALEVFIEEFKDLEENCTQEVNNFNPSNRVNIEKLITEINYIKKIIGVDNKIKDVCGKVGEFFDNENSISCNYKKSFTKTHKMCKQLNNVSSCMSKLVQLTANK